MGGHDRYGIVLDAGSSGTRIHIYRWDEATHARAHASATELKALPEIQTKKKWTKKLHPGISTFHDKPEDVGVEHLKPLFDHALDVIPSKEVARTPIYLLATAGMRLVEEKERRRLLDEVCTYTRRTTEFLLPDCEAAIQVIPGETEGLYGWIAANYLLGGFDENNVHDHGKSGHHTYGFLDMGGASAQIAFAPNATEVERYPEELKYLRMRRLDGEAVEYRVFVTTWLGYGVNEARRRYVSQLNETMGASNTKELPDPCLPKGLKETMDGKEIEDSSAAADNLHLVGTGLFAECTKSMYPLLDAEKSCATKPCLLSAAAKIPGIDFDVNHFVGVSEFWHTLHEDVFGKDEDGDGVIDHPKVYDFATYQERVTEFCDSDWSAVEKDIDAGKWGKKFDEEAAMKICFKAAWVINVLHDGIGIPRLAVEGLGSSSHNGTEEVVEAAKQKGFLESFKPMDKIDDVEVSWTLGKMVLYATSQIPPLSSSATDPKSLAVGFGNNTLSGTPSSFEFSAADVAFGTATAPYPPMISSEPSPSSVSGNYSAPADSEAHWHDALWREGDSAPRRTPGILLMLIIASIAFYLLLGRHRRARIFSSLPLSRRRKNGSMYAHLPQDAPYHDLEEGQPPTPARFELEDWDDEESAVPMSAASAVSSFNGASLAAPGMGVGVAGAMERSYSRERVGSVQLAQRSRDGSPTSAAGRRSPLPPVSGGWAGRGSI